MATTVVAPVGNSIALAQNYLPMLDELYKRESLTAMFDTSNVQWVGADTVKMMNLQTVGMGNYSRNAGYVPGDANASWETYQITKDRARSYQIDYLDNEESLSIIVGNLLGEVERLHVVPEQDAYFFAKVAGTANIDGATGSLSHNTTKDAIFAAEASMDDNEVPYEGRILFVNPTVYNYLKGEIEHRVINIDTNVNYNIEMFDDMRIVRVPSARFSTAITLANPTDHDGAGGYTATGSTINFAIIHPSAILKVMKHTRLSLFSPEQNIEADAWRLNMRYAFDTFVKTNKTKGVYVHAPSTSSG